MTRSHVAFLALAIAGAAILITFVLVWVFQATQIYRFDQSPSDPKSAGIIGLTVKGFTSGDGFGARAWVVPPRGDAPVILYFPGNYSSTAGAAARLKPFSDLGYGLAVLEYRGTGGTAGKPSEAALNMDALALYDQLDQLIGKRVPADNRLLHGFSLGSDIVTVLATRRPIGAAVLESPFASATDYYTQRFRGLPMNWLVWSERHDSVLRIGLINAPLLVLRGSRDESIPQYSFDNLVRAAPPGAEVRTYPLAGHSDMAKFGATDDILAFYRQQIGVVP